MTGARGWRLRWRRFVRERLRLIVRGAVQGVGFRPFIFRLAARHGLSGWVLNSGAGVHVEIEGPRQALEEFFLSIEPERPPRAVIQSLESVWCDASGLTGFEIRESVVPGLARTLVAPDSATCHDCCVDVADPANRRWRYPFTNCTNCGPRYSVISSLPYDRARTSMRSFVMCPECDREYHDPLDRRFHAQPNACPVCGPRVALWNARGDELASDDAAMRMTAEALGFGRIIAVKGLGGFHLMAIASSQAAVQTLRARKHRAEKPFALMVKSIEEAGALCQVSPAESRLLSSAEAPIVLLRRRLGGEGKVADAVAPANPWLGVMLPCTPLHHVLMADVGEAVVATSGNLSDEPICTDEHDAIERLGGIADLFLVHNRPILRHVDDSIVRVHLGRELVLRRARGYAPLPVTLGEDVDPVVAVGPHLKNTVAVSAGREVFVSQHIGDLETPQALNAFNQVMKNLTTLFDVEPVAAAADLHPDYVSTRAAHALGLPVTGVQHHLAHVLSCATENGLGGEVLGVSWDGTGLGSDGTIWGGEFLLVDDEQWQRWACLRPFQLPGGERAVREPRRSAFGVLQAMYGTRARSLDTPVLNRLSASERDLWCQAIDKNVNAPVTSSAGRLFDAVAAIVGIRQVTSFEGQAAMQLEWAADERATDGYPWELSPGSAFPQGSFEPPPCVVDWAPAVAAVLKDVVAGVSVAIIATRWHNTMADVIAGVARSAGRRRVVLSGGCFQNVVLCERVDRRLRDGGFAPYWHQRVPPNDGGIALGQVIATVHPRRLVRASADRRAGAPSQAVECERA